MSVVRNGHGHLVHETLNLAYLKNEFMNCADFLYADCEAIVSSSNDIILNIFDI